LAYQPSRPEQSTINGRILLILASLFTIRCNSSDTIICVYPSFVMRTYLQSIIC